MILKHIPSPAMNAHLERLQADIQICNRLQERELLVNALTSLRNGNAPQWSGVLDQCVKIGGIAPHVVTGEHLELTVAVRVPDHLLMPVLNERVRELETEVLDMAEKHGLKVEF